jgi:hypothetical protein
MRSRISLVAASVAVLALGVTGCSSSSVPGTGTGSGSTPSWAPASLPGASTASTPAVQTPAASSSSPAPVVSASSAGNGAGTDTSASLSAKLLTAADIGDGFAETTFDDKDTSSPCDAKGTPGVDEQVPPALKVGRDFVQNALSAQLEEDLQVYSDAATSAKALAALEKGLNCTKGTLYADDGSTVSVTISKANPIPAQGPVQGGDAWALKGGGIAGLAVAVKYSDTHIALLTFFAPLKTPSSKLPDFQTLISTVTKKFLT